MRKWSLKPFTKRLPLNILKEMGNYRQDGRKEYHMESVINETKILIVDDEEPIRCFLGRVLKLNGNECALAGSAAEARTIIRDHDFPLIICDIRMPGESGIDFIRYVRAEHPETAVIVASAMDDQQTVESALEIGAYGYITKPFKISEVIINVCNALRRRKLEIQNRFHRENLEKLVEERTKAVNNTLNDLRSTMEGIIQAMGLTVEIRDPYTSGHQKRVADIASAIATEMNLPKEQIKGIHMAGIVHDIGKIAVPSEILNKSGRISKHEFEIIKSHSQAGYDILKQINFPWPIAQIVYQHHERMDGSGYPQGLSDEDILLEARIMAVADVVEAMASHRPYRPALGVHKALEEIKRNRGVLFDLEVVNACLSLFEEKKFVLGD
jgi:putative two-component system response regulator